MDHADTLLEQVKQMERDLSGATAEDGENPDMSAVEAETENVSNKENLVDNLKNKVNQDKNKVDILKFGREMPEKTGEENVNLLKRTEDKRRFIRQTDVSFSTEKTGAERPALAVQLERADRAVSVPAEAETGPRERPGRENSFSILGRRPGGYTLRELEASEERRPGETSEPRLAPGGEMLWAERADRVFRRDSRRYDGGFYLY